MEIKTFTFENRENVVAFFTYLMKDLSLAFHPDDDFADYTDKDGKPTFTAEEAAKLERYLVKCWELCERAGEDIYEVAMSAHYKANKIVDFHLDSIDLDGPMGNAYALMGAWRKAAQEAGWSADEITAVIAECQMSDYEHLKDTLRKNSHQ